jgi:indole-3-glycerol phosphate synthase
MSDILDRICADKRRHIAACKATCALSEMELLAANASKTRGFAAALHTALASGIYGLIAEIKKASPSKGMIREDFEPASLARAYEEGGATCLSILTDTPYFQGRNEYLTAARGATRLPVLRKDFILDPYQVFEARAIGADCILIILAALNDTEAKELTTLAHDQGMDVLVEVHDEKELDRALMLESPLIGINNRNLKSLEVDVATTERLAPKIPDNRIRISESGLATPKDLERMASSDVRCFLIGEALMRQADVVAATRALIGVTSPAPA